MARATRTWPSDFSIADSLLNDLLGDMPIMLYSVDLAPPERVVFVSSNLATRLGYTPAELLGNWSNWISKVHPEDRNVAAKRDVGSHVPCHESIEYRVMHENGEWVWLRDEFKVKHHQGRAPVRVGYWTDISKRKSVELALRSSEHQLRELLEERDRFARDLHDGIVQALYAVGLTLEEARRVLFENPQSAQGIITQAIASLNTVIREVRQHITWGGTHALSPQQLRAELNALSATLGGMNRLRFRFDLDSNAVARLSTDTAHHVLQIVREAMSNSLRHSGGTSGVVSLSQCGEAIRLTISDNGIGFELERRAGMGLGLHNIAARARELGATVTIDSHAEHGTTVTIDIPGSRA